MEFRRRSAGFLPGAQSVTGWQSWPCLVRPAALRSIGEQLQFKGARFGLQPALPQIGDEHRLPRSQVKMLFHKRVHILLRLPFRLHAQIVVLRKHHDAFIRAERARRFPSTRRGKTLRR